MKASTWSFIGSFVISLVCFTGSARAQDSDGGVVINVKHGISAGVVSGPCGPGWFSTDTKFFLPFCREEGKEIIYGNSRGESADFHEAKCMKCVDKGSQIVRESTRPGSCPLGWLGVDTKFIRAFCADPGEEITYGNSRGEPTPSQEATCMKCKRPSSDGQSGSSSGRKPIS